MLIEELTRLGVAIDLDYVARHFPGRSYPTVRAQIRHEFNLDLPTDFEDRYRDRLLEAFRLYLNIMPGVLDVLDQLSVPCCVATPSSPRRLDLSLRLTGLDQRMEGRIFTASQVSHGKPAPGLGPGIEPARAVAPAAAAELERVLRMPSPQVIAFGTGRALRAMAEQFTFAGPVQHRIVSLLGNIAPDGSATLYDVISRIAEKLNATCYPMPVPVASDTPEEREFQAR
jgi:hypothetical protein